MAQKIQEAAYGGVEANVRTRLLRLGEAQSVFGKRRGLEVYLMPGTVLLRDWGEVTHRLEVTPDGLYRLDGKDFKSLSAAARFITGTQWSGPAFFGVRQEGGQ